MNDDFKIYLKAIIDDSSLSDVEKKLAKERLKISADIDLKDFAKNKADIEKQFQSLAGIIKKILGDAVSDRQATQWAKQYYKEIESGAKQVAKEQANIYTTAQKELKKLYDLKIQYAKLGSNKDTDYYYGNAIKKQEETYRQARANTSKPETWDFQKRLDLEREELILQDKLAKAMDTTATSAQNLSQNSKIQFAIDTEKYTAEIFAIQQQLNKFGIQSGEIFQTAQTSLTKLDAAYNGMKESDGDKRLEYEKEYQKYLETTKNLLKQITSQKSNELIPQGDNRRLTFIKQLNDYLLKNTAMASRSKEEIQGWINTLESADDMTRGSFDNLNQNFQTLDSQLRSTGKLGLSWTDKFKQAIEKFGGWALATGSVMELWNWLKQMPRTIRELDTELVDLRKTTTATTNELENFYYDSNKTAKQLGVTTKEIISQTSEWSRLGYAINDAQTLAKNSAILEAISPDLSIQESTDGLVSTLKAFRLEADDSLDGIISKINIIGNTQAVSNGDIVDILTRSSSAMAAANNTLDQTIALGTAATEITRDAAEVGTALKTISMRIRGYDEETEEYIGNIEQLSGEVASLTKSASTPGGISLFTDKTKETYKSTYQIISDIQKIWNELTDKNQAQLLEVLAGKRQGQIVSAMISNFDAAEKSMQSMESSAGNAMQEMEVIYDSLDYKLNRLAETGTGIAQNLFKRDDMKNAVDGLTTIGEAIDFVTDKLGLFGTLFVGASGILGAKGLGLT